MATLAGNMKILHQKLISKLEERKAETKNIIQREMNQLVDDLYSLVYSEMSHLLDVPLTKESIAGFKDQFLEHINNTQQIIFSSIDSGKFILLLLHFETIIIFFVITQG